MTISLPFFDREKGYIMVFTLILLFVLALLAISYAVLFREKLRQGYLDEKTLFVYYGARAGIEDVIYGLSPDGVYPFSSVSLGWSSDETDVYYKNYTSSNDGFFFPMTVSVNVVEVEDDARYTVTSIAKLDSTDFSKTLEADIIYSLNSFYVLSIKEL